MNLADSMKNVLKNKAHIFTDYWKEDVSFILKEVGNDFQRMVKSGKTSFKGLKKGNLKVSFRDFIDSGTDTFLILKVLPTRVKEGLHFFKEDLVEELENLSDTKQKTIFSLKVIGALTSFALGTIYHIRKGKIDFSLPGLKQRNMITQFIVAEVAFKLCHLFIKRFLDELEKEVSDPEELKHIHYFRQLLSDRKEEGVDGELEEGDIAIEIVEKLKNYILTGKREND